MTCARCFHRHVCGNYDLKNDVTMCKQFVGPDNVLTGAALEVVVKELKSIKASNEQLRMELRSYKLQNQDIERELSLLRIIKQTLEMQSGMKFDI